MDIYFLIALLILFCLVFLLLFFRAKYKWNKGQKILSSLDLNDYKEFKSLSIGSDSRSRWKTISGFKIDGVLLINDNNIVILPARRSLILAHTELPSLIQRNSKINPYKIEINTPNKISIKLDTHTLHLGEATVEYVVNTENAEQKKEIVKALKNWC